MTVTGFSDVARPFTAAYVIFRKGDMVAFVMRANTGWMNGYYGIAPSGKVEKGESFTDAAIREAVEEVGIVLRPEDVRQVMVCHRNESEQDISWIDTWFEALEWQGELTNAEPETHSSLDWFNVHELPDTIIPIHRYVLEQILAGKSYCEYGWNVVKNS